MKNNFMHYEIMVSIPVHEELRIVKNQIENFKYFIPGLGIVIHISDYFYQKISNDKSLNNIADVYINKQHINTDEKGIIHAHISNFNYALLYCDFDYFLMHASNDMYIKRGMADYVYKYNAGINIHKIYCNSQWWPGNYSLKDKQLAYIMEKHGINTIVGSQIEGSFYKKEIIKKVIDIIENSYLYEDVNLKYPREEIYFSTIAYHFLDKNKIGYPVTFSEVHRFDRCLWKLRYLTWGIYHRLKIEKWISKRKYEKFEVWYFNKLLHSEWYHITPHIVKKLLNQNKYFMHMNRYLNDGREKYQLYGDKIFAVKRVKRNMDDSLRQYINYLSKGGNDE